MKISWRWLQDYVDVDLSPEEAAEKLTISGTEIGSLTPLTSELSGVVVGEVISKDKHPRADRLSVCQVNVGQEVLTVICGAPNVAAGQKVPVALVGSVLPGGFKIEARAIRGVLSQGMICSEKELDISEEATGIMVLADDAPVGEALQKVLALEDMVLEADLTPNRPDCMSMVGIAREVAAICQTSVRKPAVEITEGSKPIHELVTVQVHDPEACPRYTARLIQGVKIGPSPPWLSRRLVASGVRSLNNVVDITNYVLMELGQPLHAFDYNLLAGAEIQVRRAKKGEKFVTLDEKEHLLSPEILLICDAEKPVALAGIMGGLESEVTSDTKNILLESAYFHPATTRRGSKRLNISTESSMRFERGIDPNGVLFALDRAAQLICELAGGEVAKGAVDCYPKPIEPQKITLRVQRANQLLGTKLSVDQMTAFLEGLCFETTGEDPLEVRVPTFRPDVTREIDIIEEIARLYGYDRIEARVHAGGALKIPLLWEEQAIGEIKSALCSLGLYEVVTNSLTAPALLQAIGYQEPPREIVNPLSEDLSVLRPSLIPGLLQVLRRNFHRAIRDIRIFELGTTFHPPTREDFSAEKRSLCGAIAGRRRPASWDQRDLQVDFYDLKGLLESFLNKLSIDNFNFLPYDGGVFRSGFSATLTVRDTHCGSLGQLAPKVKSAFELESDIFLFQLDVDTLMGTMAGERRYVGLPKFPAAERDLAIVVSEEVSAGDVDGAIRQAGGDMVVEVRLFDVYRGEQIAAGKKGLAYSLRYQSPEKTLTDAEVEEIQHRIMAVLEDKFEAQLRS
jgi:phenylalanyl-tRNA synthetase beta chain